MLDKIKSILAPYDPSEVVESGEVVGYTVEGNVRDKDVQRLQKAMCVIQEIGGETQYRTSKSESVGVSFEVAEEEDEEVEELSEEEEEALDFGVGGFIEDEEE